MPSMRTILSLCVIFVIFTPTLQAQTIVYIDPDAPGANDGTSWENAYLDLRQALDGALSETTLLVAEGNYSPGNRKNDSFFLKTGVGLEGGYAGYGAPDPDARDIALYATVLDGQSLNYHVVTGSNAFAYASIDGFTITGGNADGLGDDGLGGGMTINEGRPLVSNCTFTNNFATRGGGIYTEHSLSKIVGCTFLDNEAEYGAGMNNEYGELTITDCTFTSNVGERGSGVHNLFGTYSLIDCTFTGNTAKHGGAAACYNCTVLLTRSDFENNIATENGGGVNITTELPVTINSCQFNNNSAVQGGGLYLRGSFESTIANCHFEYNNATNGGGFYSKSTTNQYLEDCTFANNKVERSGGGIYFNRSHFTLTRCMIQVNRAGYSGGGMTCRKGSAILRDCTITANWAGNRGGGIYYRSFSAQVMLNHCNFNNNKANIDGGGIYSYRGIMTVSHCHFKQNKVNSGDGGGMHSHWTELLITNCLFTGNSAKGMGGGIHNYYATASVTPTSITNCTFCDNIAENSGGGVSNHNGNAIVNNSIFWENTPDQLSELAPSEMAVKYSCIQGDYPGEANIDEDPMFLDPNNGDYHLTHRSPCINRSTSDGASAEDMDGDLRPYMGSIDMGMDEFIGDHALEANGFTLSRSLGGSISFDLKAETAHAGHGYVLVGGMSGTAPGQPLPWSGIVLPINTDGFTQMMLGKLNSPLFSQFADLLQGSGISTASLNIPGNLIPPVWLSKKIHFAFAVDTYDFVSNPVEVEIVP